MLGVVFYSSPLYFLEMVAHGPGAYWMSRLAYCSEQRMCHWFYHKALNFDLRDTLTIPDRVNLKGSTHGQRSTGN